MLCDKCGIRWAPFPSDSFKIVGEDVIPLAEDAERKREEIFDNDSLATCSLCLGEAPMNQLDLEIYYSHLQETGRKEKI